MRLYKDSTSFTKPIKRLYVTTNVIKKNYLLATYTTTFLRIVRKTQYNIKVFAKE